MECGEWPYPRKPGTCACCGLPIVTLCETCGAVRTEPERENPEYRRLHLRLNNGSLLVVSFCSACSVHEWTSDRLMRLQWLGDIDPMILGRDDTPAQTWAELR